MIPNLQFSRGKPMVKRGPSIFWNPTTDAKWMKHDETVDSVSDLQESPCEGLQTLVAQAAETEPTDSTEIQVVKKLQQSTIQEYLLLNGTGQWLEIRKKYWPETQLLQQNSKFSFIMFHPFPILDFFGSNHNWIHRKQTVTAGDYGMILRSIRSPQKSCP